MFQSDLPYEFCYLRVDKYCSLSAYLNQLEWWDRKGTLLSCQYSLMAERILFCCCAIIKRWLGIALISYLVKLEEICFTATFQLKVREGHEFAVFI